MAVVGGWHWDEAKESAIQVWVPAGRVGDGGLSERSEGKSSNFCDRKFELCS